MKHSTSSSNHSTNSNHSTKSTPRKRKDNSSKAKNFNFSVKTLAGNLSTSESSLAPASSSLGPDSDECALRSSEVIDNFNLNNLKHLEQCYFHCYTGTNTQNYQDANSHGATLRGANLGGATLVRSKFVRSKFGVSTKFRGSKFGEPMFPAFEMGESDVSSQNSLLNDVWFAEFNFPVDLETFKDIVTDAARSLEEKGPVPRVKKTFKSTIFDPEIGQHITHIRRSSTDSISSVRSILSSQDSSHLTEVGMDPTTDTALDTPVDTSVSSAAGPEFKPHSDSINYVPDTDDRYYPVTKRATSHKRNTTQPVNIAKNYQINDPNTQIADSLIPSNTLIPSDTLDSQTVGPVTVDPETLNSQTVDPVTLDPMTVDSGTDSLMARGYKSEGTLYNYVEPRVKDVSYLKSDGFKQVLSRCPFLNGPNMDNKIAIDKSRTVIKKLLKQHNQKHYEDNKYHFQPFIGARRGRCENEILEGVNRSLYHRFTSSDRRKLCKSLMPRVYKKFKNLNYLQHSDKKTLLKRMNMAIDNYISICLSKKKYEFIFSDDYPLTQEHFHTRGVYGGVIPWRVKYVSGEPFQLLNFTNHATNIGQIIKQIINN